MAEGRGRILVVDDDASRHRDLRAWIERLGMTPDVRERPPREPDAAADAALVVVHAGYGRGRPGFPRAERRAEALRWMLGDPSYLFHEDLDAFAALGREIPPEVPLVVVTGGSTADVPAAALARLGRPRRVVEWNVIDLLSTSSVEEVAAGGTRTEPDPARVQSEVRHDLLNRLWNLALAAAETPPDVEEIGEIIEGDEDQSALPVLIAASGGLRARTRTSVTEAVDAAAQGSVTAELAPAVRAAIEDLEGP